MKYPNIIIGIILVLLVIGGIALLTNRDAQKPPDEEDAAATSVRVLSKTGVGNFLVDGRDMSLYLYTKDSPNKSVCYGGCAAAWPIFYVEKEDLKLPAELKKEDFGEIVRDDGSAQVTYKGLPLYYYAKDVKPGDTTGQGVGDVWYLVTP